MKRFLQRSFIAIILAGGIAVSPDCFGEMQEMSLSDLVKQGDPIVIGTLREVRGHSTNGVDYGFGKIAVSEIIWSKKPVATNILFKWQNTTHKACPRREYGGAEGAKAIWFLSLDKDGNAAGGHLTTTLTTTRIFALEQKAEILELLKKRK